MPESKIFRSKSPKVINKTLQLFCKKYSTQRALLDTKNAFLTTQLINIRQKHEKFFAQCPKMRGGKQKADTSSQNYPFARWNAVLTTQSKNFPTKVKTFGSMLDQEKVRFSSESFSAHLVPIYTWKSVLTTLSKSLSQNADGFLPNVWKLKEFLSRRRKFWQPHQQLFDKRPRTFRSRSEQKN